MILVVEDDSDIADAMHDALEAHGYDASVVGNGMQAIEKLRESAVDLILLDWMMPVMNGQMFLDSLRREPGLEGIPVIVLTADLRLAERADHLGVAGFLCKPFSLEKLCWMVAQNTRSKSKL